MRKSWVGIVLAAAAAVGCVAAEDGAGGEQALGVDPPVFTPEPGWCGGLCEGVDLRFRRRSSEHEAGSVMTADMTVFNCGTETVDVPFGVAMYVGAGVPLADFVLAVSAMVPAGMPPQTGFDLHMEISAEDYERLPHYEHPYTDFDSFWAVDYQDVVTECWDEPFQMTSDMGPQEDYY